MEAFESKYWQEGIDSKALLVCFLRRLPYLLLMGVAGAVLGSGLYLLITVMTSEGTRYQEETKYYIDFAEGKLESKNHYNAFTWNEVMTTELILDNTMEILGSDYDESEVKSAVSASIWSDVRYLTIMVEAGEEKKVAAISEATEKSLENFGICMEEFDAIYQIEDSGVQQIKESLVSWRAVLLGTLCGVLVGAFWLTAGFCMGSRYYTKQGLSKSLGVPVFGLLYQDKNEANGMQEKALWLALQHDMDKISSKSLVVMDVVNNGSAQRCKDILTSLYSEEMVDVEVRVQNSEVPSKEYYGEIRQTDGVILAIPFAKPCREVVLDKMNELENQDCKVQGAILVDVDRKWMRLYGIH